MVDSAPIGPDGPDPGRDWDFLGRRVLVVSRNLPAHDGIARYADQLLEALAGEHEFTRIVASPAGRGGVRPLWGRLRPLRLLARGRGFDDVLIHFHPYDFVRGGLPGRLVSYAALTIVARVVHATFVVHELDPPRMAELGRRGRVEFFLEERARRLFWGHSFRVVFHTEWERRRFAERFPARGVRSEHIVHHGSFFASEVSASRPEARERLGLPADRRLLLCIGFLSPHKSYERAVEAVVKAGVGTVDLHVVGSPISQKPAMLEYVAELRGLIDETPNVQLHEQILSDEEFDLWIRAADAVVVPYSTAASSGVVERTQLLGTTLIASGVGGIEEQLESRDVSFSTDEELVAAIRRLADDGGRVLGR